MDTKPIDWDPRIVKCIFVGRAGSGKTNGYPDFPKPMIVIDTDAKIHTIKYLRKDKVKIKKLDSYHDFKPDDLENIQYIRADARNFEAMDRDLRMILKDPPMSPNGTPGTFVIDSLTSIADNTINYSLAQRESSGKSTGVIKIPDLPEWLAESMYLSSLFTDVKALPCHAILTAHMVITTRDVMASKADRARGAPGLVTKETKQLMTGGTKIGAKVPVYFDEVWNFQGIPSVDYGSPPERVVFTSITDECDIGRTKLPLPYKIDLTYNYNNPGLSLWDHVEKAIGEVINVIEGDGLPTTEE